MPISQDMDKVSLDHFQPHLHLSEVSHSSYQSMKEYRVHLPTEGTSKSSLLSGINQESSSSMLRTWCLEHIPFCPPLEAFSFSMRLSLQKTRHRGFLCPRASEPPSVDSRSHVWFPKPIILLTLPPLPSSPLSSTPDSGPVALS